MLPEHDYIQEDREIARGAKGMKDSGKVWADRGPNEEAGRPAADVIALPRSFPRTRGNQENNEWGRSALE